jgi:hypothetical protein
MHTPCSSARAQLRLCVSRHSPVQTIAPSPIARVVRSVVRFRYHATTLCISLAIKYVRFMKRVYSDAGKGQRLSPPSSSQQRRLACQACETGVSAARVRSLTTNMRHKSHAALYMVVGLLLQSRSGSMPEALGMKFRSWPFIQSIWLKACVCTMASN